MKPVGWMARPDPYAVARARLVRSMVEQGIIRSDSVREAFLATPREAFVPTETPAETYADSTIPISGRAGEWLTTSSQPTMMAIMLEQLAVEPGHRVLEIGGGTGYNAALLACLAGEGGSVDSVEIDEEAAAGAARALVAIGSLARMHGADGADGWPEGAPYDRVIASVGVPDIPTAWADQAGPGAAIVAPLHVLGCDYSAALHRDGTDWVSSSIEPCAFVRFQGRLASRETRLTIGDPDAPALTLCGEAGQLPPPAAVTRWLEAGNGTSLPPLTRRGEWDGFALWLLAHAGSLRVIRATSGGRGVGWGGPAAGLWDEAGMAVISPAGRLARFGTGGAADSLRAAYAEWRNTGAPGLSRLRLRLRPGQIDDAGWLKRTCHSITVETLPARPV